MCLSVRHMTHSPTITRTICVRSSLFTLTSFERILLRARQRLTQRIHKLARRTGMRGASGLAIFETWDCHGACQPKPFSHVHIVLPRVSNTAKPGAPADPSAWRYSNHSQTVVIRRYRKPIRAGPITYEMAILRQLFFNSAAALLLHGHSDHVSSV